MGIFERKIGYFGAKACGYLVRKVDISAKRLISNVDIWQKKWIFSNHTFSAAGSQANIQSDRFKS